MSTPTFNDLDPADDPAFPGISAFDPAISPPPEPPPPGDEVLPPLVDVTPGPDDEIDPADLVIDESQLDDEELLEAAAPEPEEITDIEIGVD